MPTYILLLTLTQTGRDKILQNPEAVLHAERGVKVRGVQTLGLYAVLGPYDFVGIIEAPDNEAAGRFSIQLGAGAGVNILTMPTLPVTRLEPDDQPERRLSEVGAAVSPPDDLPARGRR